MLRAKKPEAVKKRFKAFFFGDAGCGKTMMTLNFPAPYMIDTERGAENDQYLALLEKNEGVIFQTGDFDEIFAEVKTLLSVAHPYKTLIIDPITSIYSDLIDKCEEYLINHPKENRGFTGAYQMAEKQMKKLLKLILRLDMNVILTAHAKTEYGTVAGKLEALGVTFDGYKKLKFTFDLVVKVDLFGEERVGFVTKSRLDGFKVNTKFPFTFEEINMRNALDKRYKALDAPAMHIELATEPQLTELLRLVDLLKISQEVQDKWLTKENVNELSEMSTGAIQLYINGCKAKLTVNN